MNLPEPARPQDVSQGAGVVAVCLVRHRLHRRIGPPGLDSDRRQAGFRQSVMQPRRQRAGFESDTLQSQTRTS